MKLIEVLRNYFVNDWRFSCSWFKL